MLKKQDTNNKKNCSKLPKGLEEDIPAPSKDASEVNTCIFFISFGNVSAVLL